MNIQLQCQCGIVKGFVESKYSYGRAMCYCHDCRAYIRFLGHEHEILNQQGGTDTLAMLPAAVHIREGIDQLACMSLSPRGLLRWYTRCCRTPIGHTPRNQKISYVGLVWWSLPSLNASGIPLNMVINISSATGAVKSTPIASFFGTVRVIWNLIVARVTRKYQLNPFFVENSDTPIKVPYVLTKAERDALSDRNNESL